MVNNNDKVVEGNVVLVDPNQINADSGIYNAIPKYENMFIYVDLIAERRGRTVLTTTGVSSSNVTESTTDETVKINFMGFNQNKGFNENSFTTKFYDDGDPSSIQHESFGITNIDITVNSSYVPQINIEFTDVRGLSFFNKKNSPYRVLFDFPPPIFTLTVKGYYGKALEYKMHLVDYTNEFKAENGNYVINCNFIALTYAPLTDVLFRYIYNTSLLNKPKDSVISDTNTTEPPKTTFELVSRLKNLYSSIQRSLDLSGDEEKLTTIINNLKQVNDKISIINTYRTNDKLNVGKPCQMFMWDSDNDSEINTERGLTSINTVGQYNTIISGFGSDSIPNDVNVRLVIGFESIGDDISGGDSVLRNRLAVFRNNVLNVNNLTTETIEWDGTSYVVLDITTYYIGLYNQRTNLLKQRTQETQNINNRINDIVVGNLGMRPTIYNIFKLILDDVDTFFKLLRLTSENAENSHNDETIRSRLLGSGSSFKDVGLEEGGKIYSFPLIIDQKEDGWCNTTERVRVSPIKLGETIGYNFPEMDFVDGFINTFKLQAQLDVLNNMRTEVDGSNNNIWIPFSPMDSSILASAESPYLNAIFGGGDLLNSLYDVLLNRFYIITQYAIRDLYLDGNYRDLVKFYVEAEAVNLAQSLTTEDSLSLMTQQCNKYRNNINSFFNDIENTEKYLLSNNTNTLDFDSDVHNNGVNIDKTNDNFIGLTIYNNNVLTGSSNRVSGDDPVSRFLSNINNKNWVERWIRSSEPVDYLFYSKENLLLFLDEKQPSDKDRESNQTPITSVGNYKRTLYFGENIRIGSLTPGFNFDGDTITFSTDGGELRNVFLDNINQNGVRKSVNTNDVVNYVVNNELGSDFYDTILNKNGDIVENIPRAEYGRLFNRGGREISQFIGRGMLIYEQYLTNQSDQTIKELLLYSLFNNIQTPLTQYPRRFNRVIYNKPIIAQLPKTVIYYMGLMCKLINEDENNNNLNRDKIIDFINDFKVIDESHPITMLTDYYDMKNYLSKSDKNSLIIQYDLFKSFSYDGLIESISQVIDRFSGNDKNSDNYIREIEQNHDNSILRTLGDKVFILVHSTLTFKKSNVDIPTRYLSLNELRSDGGMLKRLSDGYFNLFFTKLNDYLKDQTRENNNREKELNKIANDNDIRTQTYYSFKNINDKWLSGTTGRGYPFGGNKPLIDSFAFVNRAMHPIGDTIINPELLLDVIQDPNITIYSVLSQILSTNGFEFFPLQNFMDYGNDNSWADSFKLDTSGRVKNSPVFVCMYIGGASSYPSNISSFGRNFVDDGISDMSDLSDTDFIIPDCDGSSSFDDDNQNVSENNGFTYSKVRAFRVRYGEQNQSMFTDFKVESKEYPETNESIQILSRLAGDGGVQAPIPKGQNLYSLYENRSYKATITSLGNVCIQPTQYFQLENVPLYNGAYVILEVKHNIKPNFMLTTISGTKILKYPMPRVKEIATAFGFDGGRSDETSIGGQSSSASRPAYSDESLGDRVVSVSNVNEQIKFT